jgi:hypothetical protein
VSKLASLRAQYERNHSPEVHAEIGKYTNMQRYLKRDTVSALETLKQLLPDKELEKWLKIRARVKKRYDNYVAEVNKQFLHFEKEYEQVNTWSPLKIRAFIGFLEKEVNRIKVQENRNKYHKKGEFYGKTKFEKIEDYTRRFMQGRGKYPVTLLYQQTKQNVTSFLYGTLEQEELYDKPMLTMIHRKIILEMFIGILVKRSVE